MRIKDKPGFYDKPKPVTFRAQANVQQALDLMCKHNIGSVVIVDEHDAVKGIVTERDMMRKVLGEKRDPHATTLAQIMTSPIHTASPDDELVDWIETMTNERFRHLPVVDEQGKLMCVVSQGDFVAHTHNDLSEKLRQDIKGRLGHGFQFLLIALAAITLFLIALGK